ncbi:MAG: hypothetical protein JSV49_10350 [Thermoplasmata archaeon]|nr:MAG: hypothetical protein JSV49_10350 [Thermoplasmata archaeon]
MLEEIEMRYILTDKDGKLYGCYSEYEHAELDAKDLAEGKDGEDSLYIYELLTAQKIGEPYLQNIYELRKSFPEVAESEEKSDL